MIASILLTLLLGTHSEAATNLVSNPNFDRADATGKAPAGYELTGNARWAWCGYSDEITTKGISLNGFDAKGSSAGSVSQLVTGIQPKNGKWLKFRFRGRAEDGFTVGNDLVGMKMGFYSNGGTNYLDSGQRLIYREILKDRKDFAVNGNDGKNGATAWRSYEFEEMLPFAEVDAVKLTVEFKNGNATQNKFSSFYITDFSLQQSAKSSDGRVAPTAKQSAQVSPESTAGMLPLGGRWFYRPAQGESVPIDTAGHLSGDLNVTEANSARLFYQDERLENPFAGNMTAWLRKGNLDVNRQLVNEDRYLTDNVTITFNASGYMALHVRNIPNHPTAKFPDTVGTQGYNPSYIQEHNDTYYLPVNPVKNPNAVAMTDRDANGALNMGPVGLAVNGVVFYNPYDANMVDASNIMDRCCGHPSPDNRYHYHKYPICVNTPFVDKGESHSPIIGFALDGFPVYGPYERSGEMAKDDKERPLNAFNAHFDDVRGWHYHVTPGKFPYIIGGYMGNRPQRSR